MAPMPAMAAICDRGDCPAPAQHTVVLHGQDLHFCGHHTVELVETLFETDQFQQPDRRARQTVHPIVADPLPLGHAR